MGTLLSMLPVGDGTEDQTVLLADDDEEAGDDKLAQPARAPWTGVSQTRAAVMV
jgi:hypothetical protein